MEMHDLAPAPYAGPIDHLHDELWRVWLRVEYEVRNRIELGALGHATGDPLGIFAAAHTEFVGTPRVRSDAGVAQLLEAFVRHSQTIERRLEASRAAGVVLPLPRIASTFGLSPRQIATLTFALMPEMDPNLVLALRLLSHDPNCRGMDARLLAMLVYDTPESRAELSLDLSSVSPLFLHRLLEDDSEGMGFRRLRPASRLVQVMCGATDVLDPELLDVAELRGAPAPAIFPEVLTRRASSALQANVVLVLQGQRGLGKRLLAQHAAWQLGRPLLVVDTRRLAAHGKDALRHLIRCLVREARLLDAVPVVPEVDDFGPAGEDAPRAELPEAVAALLRDHPGSVVLTLCREDVPRITERPVVQLQLNLPSLTERRDLWRLQLPELPAEDAMALSERFATTGGVITQAARAAAAVRLPGDGPLDIETLDRAVRGQLQDSLSRLGRRIETRFTFNDLVVDDDTGDTLVEIVACIRQRRQVREEWGFRGPPGVSVLFSGDPGVGKTMSATVLARELGLAVYEIDLSQVVSKWIGETEKNLSELFDAAEPGHVVLLFNEADSLFGKRMADVKTSTDRYANLETNYLLQRLERFGGLAILTTNLSKAIDPAFRRRFAYDVQFAYPSAKMRAELWRRAIPAKAKVARIDYDELGRRYEMSGGFIKVATERAAFLSASVGEPICVESITIAIERMYRERGKLEARGRLE